MKQNLLLLHGALGSKSQFNRVLDELSKTFTVHALNFEGHGGSDTANQFSISLFTQNVLDYLQENAINQTAIFGYSMGGYVALNVALKAPKKVKKIGTLGTKFAWDLEAAQKEVQLLNPSVIEQKVPQFAKQLQELHKPQDWKKVMNKTAQMMLNMAQGAKLVDSDFKKIAQPVSIGIGSLDKMVTYQESQYVTTLLQNATLVKLEGVKHPIDLVESDELIGYILTNLSE